MSTSYLPSDLERAIARTKSYIGAAIAVLLLYNLFWLPGFIVNIAYLSEARRMGKVAGQPVSGIGCLWLMLFYGIVIPILAIVGAVIAYVVANRVSGGASFKQ
jgi:hypothetical protein